MPSQAPASETVELSLVETAVKELLKTEFSDFYQQYFSGQVKVSEELNYDKDRVILTIIIGIKDEQYPTKETVESFFKDYMKPIMEAIRKLTVVRDAIENNEYSYSNIFFPAAQKLKKHLINE